MTYTAGALPSAFYDAVIDDDRSRSAFGLLMSLNMLIETPGGFDDTGPQCQSWRRNAGFRETQRDWSGLELAERRRPCWPEVSRS
jgi:hypothetical protein